MAVKIRTYRRGGFEVDINVLLPGGTRMRERRKSPVSSRSGARRWGEARERFLVQHGSRKPRKEVPTFEEFWPRFMEGHCRANHHKPSGMEGKESTFRNHLGPMFGKKKLDAVVQEDVARIKRRLIDKKPATVNNALTVLSMVLKVAVEWELLEKMPVRIRLLRVQKSVPRFYDFDQFKWLVEAAGKIDERILVVVLLGGEAGLRRGEILALDWAAVDLRRGLLTVERSEWKGAVTEVKGLEYRVVPMTTRLREVLARHKHLRGERVLYTDAGETATAKVLQKWMARAQKRAGLRASGALHLLRHTFCSHLAMKGAPALSIQRLAGHRNLQTTLRYMHLAPGETDRAIRMLETPNPVYESGSASDEIIEQKSGDILETAPFAGPKLSVVE
jgi:integrase